MDSLNALSLLDIPRPSLIVNFEKDKKFTFLDKSPFMKQKQNAVINNDNKVRSNSNSLTSLSN